MHGFCGNIGRKQARSGFDDAVVRLGELVAQAVDVHVVGARQPPDLLPGDIGPAEQRMPGQGAPAVAVGMDRQVRVPAQLDHADEADGVEARHDAGAAEAAHQIVPALHLIELAREVEGVHRLLSRALRHVVDGSHHRPDPLVEGAMRRRPPAVRRP